MVDTRLREATGMNWPLIVLLGGVGACLGWIAGTIYLLVKGDDNLDIFWDDEEL